MKKTTIFLTALWVFSPSIQAKEKITLLQDWLVNPDHAAAIVVQQQGYFTTNDLDVEIIEPADPSMPPKSVAAKQANIAVDYQPHVLGQATTYLINHPEEVWRIFANYKVKGLDTELNRLAWHDTLPGLALRPCVLENACYENMAQYMQQQGVIKTVPSLADYTVRLAQ